MIDIVLQKNLIDRVTEHQERRSSTTEGLYQILLHDLQLMEEAGIRTDRKYSDAQPEYPVISLFKELAHNVDQENISASVQSSIDFYKALNNYRRKQE